MTGHSHTRGAESSSADEQPTGRDGVGVWAELRSRRAFWVAATIVILMMLVALVPGLFANWFGHGDPTACNLANSVLGPRAGHPFGFDVQGCDVYANVIYGTRDSIAVGLLATGISFIVGVLLGSVSGYYGKLLDSIIARISDVFFGFPFLLGAIVILSTFRLRNVFSVSLVLALFIWPTLTRLMRSAVLPIRDADYVLAARSLGASDLRVIRRHVLPNALAPVVVIAMVTIGTVIAAEAALTFLGIGLQAPSISWGLQLANAQGGFQSYPHLIVAPGLFLSLTVFGFVLLGDAFQDALDPRSR